MRSSLPPFTTPLTRRGFLGATLGVSAAGVLSACSTGPLVEYDTTGGPVTGGILRSG